MTGPYRDYQEKYFSLPEWQREIEKFFHNKEALELNVALDKQLQLRDVRKNNSEIVEDILAQSENILPPVMPQEWYTDAILVQRYSMLCDVISHNKNWWKKNNIQLQADGIYFNDLWITLELEDRWLQDWNAYIDNTRTITIEQLRKIGDIIEGVHEENRDELINFFWFQTTAAYWSSSTQEENDEYAWYYNFWWHLYGNLEKKSIFLHTRYTK